MASVGGDMAGHDRDDLGVGAAATGRVGCGRNPGHESMDTTQIYLHTNIELKEKALAKTKPFEGRARRNRPPDQILSFLRGL